MLEVILDILLSALFLLIYHSDFTPASSPTISAPEPIADKSTTCPSVVIIDTPELPIIPIDQPIIRTIVKPSTRTKAKAKPAASASISIATTSEPAKSLNQLLVSDLRKICTERSIVWRNANGKNKHLTKAQMIALL